VKKLILFFFIIIGANVSIGQNSKAIDHYKTEDFDVAIFSEGVDVRDVIDTTLHMRFSPVRMEVKRCEDSLLKEKIVHYIGMDSLGKIEQSFTIFNKGKLVKYQRQYFGFIDRKGDKILVINAFNGSVGIDWLKTVVDYTDGDTWVLSFNLSTGEFGDITYSATLGL
jgi:hypothetical protein